MDPAGSGCAPGGVSVAAAGAADRPAVLRLLRAQLEEHAIALDQGRLARAVDGALADPGRAQLLVARRGGEAVGVARRGDEAVGVAYLSFTWALEHGGRTAWLEELYVEPPWRGRGIGRRLLLAALEHARATGCAAVDLEVEAGHERAARLYEREGFRRHRRERWVLPLRGEPG